MSNFMKLQSRSYRTYYGLLESYNLNPTDFTVASYLIPKVKTSAKFGEHGKNGKCFYRNDNKVKGVYFATKLSILLKDFPFKIGKRTLERSFKRLEHYGIIFESQTIKTKKSGIQIFMPILDSDIKRFLNDNNYKTEININTKDGKKYKNGIIDLAKMAISTSSKWLYRKCQNGNLNNDHIINNHIKKNHVCNDGHGRHHQQSNKFKIKSMGLPTNVMKVIYKYASNKHEAISYVTEITKAKEYINKKCDYNDIHKHGFDRNETNDYIQSDPNSSNQSNHLFQSLGEVFTLNSDLMTTIESEYKNYIQKNTNIHFKNSFKHKQNTGYQPDIDKIQANLKYEYTNMKQCEKNGDKDGYLKHEEAYKEENENAKDYCNNPCNHISMMYVHYSTKWIKDNTYHRTNPELQRICKIGLMKQQAE